MIFLDADRWPERVQRKRRPRCVGDRDLLVEGSNSESPPDHCQSFHGLRRRCRDGSGDWLRTPRRHWRCPRQMARPSPTASSDDLARADGCDGVLIQREVRGDRQRGGTLDCDAGDRGRERANVQRQPLGKIAERRLRPRTGCARRRQLAPLAGFRRRPHGSAGIFFPVRSNGVPTS